MRKVEADEGADGAGVLLDAPEIGGVLSRRSAAIAGAHRVDEDEVGHVEPSIGIVDKLLRCGQKVAVRGGRDDTRAQRSEMQIGGRRARPAVEDEGDRTPRALRAGRQGVGHVEDLGRNGSVAAQQRKRACLRTIIEGFPGNRDRMFGRLRRG